MVVRAPAVLAGPRVRLAAAGLALALLALWDASAGSLPGLPLWADVLLTAVVLTPVTTAFAWLLAPLHARRETIPLAVALAVLAAAWVAAGWDVPANLAKLAAATAAGFAFLALFEAASWIVLVAAVVPFADALSVWRGPTRLIVSERPDVFDALSYAFPLPGGGSFQLGIPDLLFCALFLAACVRWGLRLTPTWLAAAASFGVTMALAIWVDPFGLGGLPALPLLSAAFLGVNADILLRQRRAAEEPEPS